ncbi:MAG TPA: hypothetical protein VHS53_01920 [Mucilaginibacter sp.]|nr:hypothetical protein [Mucilaginibacter sp.]
MKAFIIEKFTIMFENELGKYYNKGFFTFKYWESFTEKCNAPIDQSGVYLIYKIADDKETLIYIGSSGQRNNDGTLKTRKDGIYGRLVKGYHPNRFGQQKRIQRQRAFPMQMQAEKITEIKIYWWITYDEPHSDFPTDVDEILKRKYCALFKTLPTWHQNKVENPVINL